MEPTPNVKSGAIEMTDRSARAKPTDISASSKPGPTPTGSQSPDVAPHSAGLNTGKAAQFAPARSLDHLSAALQEKWRIALNEMTSHNGGPTDAAKALIKESMETFPKDAELRKLYVYVGENRPIDLDAVATMLTSIRGAAYNKTLAGEPAKSDQEVAVDVKKLVANSTEIFNNTLETHYLKPETTGKHILDTASSSGTSYVAPAWISTILLYHVVPLLAAANSKVGFAALQLVAALQFLLLAKKQQSMAVLPNELVQSKGSAKVETASTVKYKQLQGQSAVNLQQKTQDIKAAKTEYNKDITEAKAMVADATKNLCEHLDGMLSEVGSEELNELLASAKQFIDVKLDGSRAQLAHETTEGGHIRQDVGQYYRSMVSVARPIVTLAPTLLRYIPAYAEAVGAWQTAGITMGVANIAQGVAHVASRADERNKVKMKPVLNALAAPVISREGEIGLMQGQPLRAEHIDGTEWRKLLPNPSQSMSGRIAKAMERDLKNPGLTETERDELTLEIDKVKTGQIGAQDLNPTGHAAKYFHEAANGSLVKDYFAYNLSPPDFIKNKLVDTSKEHRLLFSEAKQKDNDRDEIKSQLIQQIGRTYHWGIGGSYVSNTVARDLAFASGGLTKAHPAAVAGVLVAGLSASLVTTYSSSETQTMKNVNKEADAAFKKAGGRADPEAAVASGVQKPPSVTSRVGAALHSADQRWKGATASQEAAKALDKELHQDADLLEVAFGIQEAVLGLLERRAAEASRYEDGEELSRVKTVSSEGSMDIRPAPSNV